jgi:hypothetical protein
MVKGTGGFKNIKLGKNVYRQIKRRGPPSPVPAKHRKAEQNIKSYSKPKEP